MIVSRKTTDQYNILNNITGYPDCMMSISQLLSLRQNANAVVLYPLIVNGVVRYEFTPLIISQNTSNIYLLNNNASGTLPTNFYDGTIAYSDTMTPTDSSMFCYNTNLNRFEERGISITSFTRNNIGYRYYNLSDTSGLEGAIYIPDWIENVYINDELLLNWQNVSIRLNHNITQATIVNLNAGSSDLECNYDSNTLFTAGTDFRDFVISGTEYNQDMIFADDELMLYKKNESYIQCYSYYHSASDYGGGWKVYYQGESIGGWDGSILGKYDKYYGVAFLVDEEHEYGQIIACYSYYPNTSWSRKHHTKRIVNDNNNNQLHKAYLLIKEILTGAKVKVNYMIPEGDYSYCKLTYKADYQPENQNDGTSIDISPSGSSVNVEGLDENQLYYFTLFTDKSESEPFPFTVTPDPVPPEYKSFIDNINGTGFNWIKELEQDTATITNSDHSTFTSNMYKYYPMNKITWYTYNNNGTDLDIWGKTHFSGQTTALFVSTTIDKVEINSNNGVYSCTIRKNNNDTTDTKYMFVYDKTITMGGVYTDATLPRKLCGNFNNHSDYLAYGPNCNPWYNGSWSTKTFTGTLTEVFTQLQRYVRNIDIYVDGELWSKAGK